MGTAALIFPPQWCPTYPYLSLPSLTAYLKSKGHKVYQYDMNIQAYNQFLSPIYLDQRLKAIARRFCELDSKLLLTPAEQHEYKILFDTQAVGTYVSAALSWAKETFRSDAFYDFQRLEESNWIINRALEIVSASFYPSRFSIASFDMTYSPYNVHDILQAVQDTHQNPFVDFLPSIMQQWLESISPSLVGISIIGSTQVIPGFTIGAWVKRRFPEAHVVMGGSIITRWYDVLSQSSELFDICLDSACLYEGELPLCKLLDAIDNKEPGFSNVPNLIYKDSDGIIKQTSVISPMDTDELPTPDFDGLPLELYLAPQAVLPLLTSRGCYWNRCAFCDHSHIYGNRYSPRSVDKIISDIKVLQQRYRVRHFAFSDEATSPATLRALSAKITREHLDIAWITQARFEKAFIESTICREMSQAGLKALYLGLESGSDKILGIMNKGISLDVVRDTCKALTDANIWTHLFIMFGFPAEDIEDAYKTIDFIENHSGVIQSVGASTFGLCKFSRMCQISTRYGIKSFGPAKMHDLPLVYQFECEKRLSDDVIANCHRKLEVAIQKHFPHFKVWRDLERGQLLLYLDYYGMAKIRYSGLVEAVTCPVTQPLELSTISSGRIRLSSHSYVGTTRYDPASMPSIANQNKGYVYPQGRQYLFNIKTGVLLEITQAAKYVLDCCVGGVTLKDLYAKMAQEYNTNCSTAETSIYPLLQTLFVEGFLEVDE